MALLVHGITKGSAEAAPYCICANALLALCSPFDGEPDAVFADPDAVASLAVAHNARLSDTAAQMDVLPLRLGTICADQTGVRALLEREGDRFRKGLSHISDALEMGVRVTVEASVPDAELSSQSAKSGRDYLRRRAQATANRRSASGDRMQFMNTVMETLAPLTRDVRKLPQAARSQPQAAQRLMDVAFLVRRPDRETFAKTVESLNAAATRHGLGLSLNGPWPAYNFMPEV